MTKLQGEAKRFSKYGLIGLVNNLVLYILFVLLVQVGVQPVLVSGICYILGVAFSYTLNRRWTFTSQSSHTHDLPRFLTAYAVGLVSTVVTMTVLLFWLPPEIAQLLNIIITAIVIYTMLRLLNFGEGYRGSAN